MKPFAVTGHPNARGEALYRARNDLGLWRENAARLLGITPHELSALETGRAVFEDPADWERAVDVWKKQKARL